MAREMKDSGVEWIGEIPREWEVIKLKQLGTFINGYAFKPEDWCNHGKKIIRIQDLTGSGNSTNYFSGEIDYKYLIKKNDILISWAATLAAFIWDKEEAWLNQHIFKLIHNENIINRVYCYWLMKVVMENMNNGNKNGIVMQHVTLKIFRNFFATLPPLEEQEKIANYLDKKVSDIDLIIEKTKATIEDYKKYKQSIITEAVTKGINPNVEMKDSGIEWIGEIPREWEVRKLKTFLSTISKGTTPKEISLFKNETYQVRYIKSENIVNNIVINIPEFFISMKVHEELKRSQLEENDILIVIAGAGIGKTAILPKSLLPCNTNQAISFLRLNKNFYYKKYIWYVLQSDILKIFILLYSVQSAQPNLSMENLENLKIAISTQEQEIEKIINYLDKKTSEIDTLITKKEALIAELEEYKKSLIYECVTGKKEIK